MACRSNRNCAPSVAVLLIAGSILLTACGDTDNNPEEGLIDDSPTQPVSTEPQEDIRGIDVLFRDHNGARLDEVTLMVINDAVNGNLVDDDVETVIAENGATRVVVRDEADEVVVRLEAEKAGYFSNGGRYTLQPGDNQKVIIVLTADDADESGVRVDSVEGDLSQGSLSLDTTAQNDPTAVRTTVTLPQDLEIFDVDGNELDDQLRVSAVYFDSRDAQALTAFPGGFDVYIENIEDVDTASIEGFVPADFIADALDSGTPGNGPPDIETPGNGPPDENPGNGPPDENPGNGPPDENPGNGPPDENPGNGPPVVIVPGGPPLTLEDQLEQLHNVIFQSAGYTAIDIFDSQGRKADRFNGAINVTMTIPENAENPNTGGLITEGDVIPLWSFDTDSAEWNYEGTEPVTRAPDEELQVAFDAEHLSYWNLDFYTLNTCDAQINVDIISVVGAITGDVPVNVVLLGAGNNIGYRRDEMLSSRTPTTLQGISDELKLTARFESLNPDRIVFRTISLNGEPYSGQEVDFCGPNNFVITTNGSNNTLATLFKFDYDVNVRARCTNAPNTATQPIPNVHTFFSAVAGGTYVTGRTNDRGSSSLSGSGNPVGTVYASYNGQVLSQDVDAENTTANFEFDTECVVTTGITGINGQ